MGRRGWAVVAVAAALSGGCHGSESKAPESAGDGAADGTAGGSDGTAGDGAVDGADGTAGDGAPGDGTQGDGADGTAGDGAPGDDLAPAEGALIGLYYGDGTMEQTAQKLGRTPPLHLTYYDFTHDWVSEVTRDDVAAGRIPFVNWEVFDTPLDEIIAGQHDAMLAERAAAAKALGARFFLDFGAEMNGEWSPWGGAQNGMSPDKYIAAYRHVHDALADVDNAVWVWCPNVTDEPRAAWNAAMGYYPGDAYVDWTCVDGYNWGTTDNIGWESFSDIFADIYAELATKNKPIMIGEMASAEGGGDKAAWIDTIVPTLKDQFPRIKGLIWFDIDKETDWRISSSPAAEAAFKRLVNDPYLNP